MKLKTISGHYDSVFSLAHNNRDFIPNNVDPSRTCLNYNCVVAGDEVYMELDDPRFFHDFLKRYQEVGEIYWSDRALAQQLEYEQFRRELEWIRNRRMRWWREDHGLAELLLTLLFLPLIIADEVYWDQRYADAVEEWKDFKWEQLLRDANYKASKEAFRQALQDYDLREGTQILHHMDGLVTEMAAYAGDVVNASEKCEFPPTVEPRFATVDEIYSKLYEPAFREFQEKQRPSRRYAGTYLEYIREQQRGEITKKQLNRNSRNRKMTEAFEIVFGIGDMTNTGYEHAFSDAEKSEVLLKDFCDHLLQQKNICFITTKELQRPGWQPPFNNGLIILNLNVHCDEATPGIHMTFIPYSRNCARGPAVQPSVSRAFAGMGYPTSWKDALDENGMPIPKKNRKGEIIYNKDGSVRYKKEPNGQGVIDWIEDQKNWIQKEMLERYGWEREYKGSHPRGNLSTPDYKVAKAEERRQEIERHINKQKEAFDAHINKLILHLDESVDKVWSGTDDWEKILTYLKICPQDEFENIYRQATQFLDYLPQKEKTERKQQLYEIIRAAEEKGETQASEKIDLFRMGQR